MKALAHLILVVSTHAAFAQGHYDDRLADNREYGSPAMSWIESRPDLDILKCKPGCQGKAKSCGRHQDANSCEADNSDSRCFWSCE